MNEFMATKIILCTKIVYSARIHKLFRSDSKDIYEV